MPRAKVRLYTLDELTALRPKLEARDVELTQRIGELAAGERTTDAAGELRDLAHYLVRVRVLLTSHVSPLTNCTELARMTGEPQYVPWLDECGLED